LEQTVDVIEAITSRRSIRGFLDKPVDGQTLRRVMQTAARAASGGNLQPWHIHAIGGPTLVELKAIMAQRVLAGPAGEPCDYKIYPDSLWSPYRDRRYKVGEDLYASLGIGRDDKAGRLRQFARNFQFFGAPAALFCYVDRGMGQPQWSDLGMYLQTVMILLRGEGLDSCAQECWSVYPKTVSDFLGTPQQHMLFCGMAIGYADPNEPANTLVTERAPLQEFATFRGI
jgi:nitroreductase